MTKDQRTKEARLFTLKRMQEMRWEGVFDPNSFEVMADFAMEAVRAERGRIAAVLREWQADICHRELLYREGFWAARDVMLLEILFLDLEAK